MEQLMLMTQPTATTGRSCRIELLHRILAPVPIKRKLPHSKKRLTEEGIAQRHLLNPLHVRVIHKLRINVEEHRHIHRLPSIQSLLLETETLDLAEMRRHLPRCHAVRRYPNDILRRLIRRRVERQRRLTRQNPHFTLLWCEAPGEHVGN